MPSSRPASKEEQATLRGILRKDDGRMKGSGREGGRARAWAARAGVEGELVEGEEKWGGLGEAGWAQGLARKDGGGDEEWARGVDEGGHGKVRRARGRERGRREGMAAAATSGRSPACTGAFRAPLWRAWPFSGRSILCTQPCICVCASALDLCVHGQTF